LIPSFRWYNTIVYNPVNNNGININESNSCANTLHVNINAIILNSYAAEVAKHWCQISEMTMRNNRKVLWIDDQME